MKKLIFKTLLILTIILVVVTGVFLIWAYKPVESFGPLTYQRVTPDYWPTQQWRYSTPEAQGMNSDTLLRMIDSYKEAAVNDPQLYIDSMTVVRNGYIVAEFYNNPLFKNNDMHVIHSVTKSIVSTLIGIAMDNGYIASVDTPVVDIFPDHVINNLDDRKQAMTVRDLLSMQTGLHSRDSFLYAYEGLFALQHSDDWLQYALDLPMAANPGERFDYSNISTFLLSAIIIQTTGLDTLAFAKQHLFEPLGIRDVKWEWNAQGLPIAWARMWLRPNDMAKIGLLYLQQGQWQDKRIVSAQWIQDSVTPSAYPQNAVDILNEDMSTNRDASTRNWVGNRFIRPFADGYGYQWRLDRNGEYTALGTNGQYIAVSPVHNLVFIVTSKSSGIAQFDAAKLFYDFVIPAAESGESLSPNAVAAEKLKLLAEPPALTNEATAVDKLPSIANAISGRTYGLQPNPFKTNNLRFVFTDGKPSAELSYTARENWDISFSIGLDGVHRLTETNDSTFAATGSWTSPDTFSIDVEILGYSTFDHWQFRFEDNKVTVTERSISGEFTYTGTAE